MAEATSPEREKEEQRRWRLRPEREGYTAHDRLLENEFLDPDEITRLQDRALYRMRRQAGQAVPFYRLYFERVGTTPVASACSRSARMLSA